MAHISRYLRRSRGGGGSYLSLSTEKMQVATYVNIRSVCAAIEHFSKAIGKHLLGEDWGQGAQKGATEKALTSSGNVAMQNLIL